MKKKSTKNIYKSTRNVKIHKKYKNPQKIQKEYEKCTKKL